MTPDSALSISNATHEAAPVLRWPPDRFYWAVLDSMGWKGSGELPPGLLPSLADELPVPLDSIHAVAAPIDGKNVIVCACSRDFLEKAEPRTCALVPAAFPEPLAPDLGGVDTSRLNLLFGPFEPQPMLRTRRSRHVAAAAACFVCAVLIAIGLVRRTRFEQTFAVAATRAADTLLATHAPDRREHSLAERVRLMRSIVEAANKARPPHDAAASLESFLKSWPTSIASKPQSMTIAADGISMGVVIEGDATPFLRALVPTPGFQLDEPRIASAGPVTRVSLHLRPAGGSN